MKAKAAADADAADEGDDNNDVEYCDDMLFIFERQMQVRIHRDECWHTYTYAGVDLRLVNRTGEW